MAETARVISSVAPLHDSRVAWTKHPERNKYTVPRFPRGISYTVVELDEGPAITCSPEDRNAFHELFMSVLRGEFNE